MQKNQIYKKFQANLLNFVLQSYYEFSVIFCFKPVQSHISEQDATFRATKVYE
jgi:hypothetical protein